MYYYELHVFYSRKESKSIYVKLDKSETFFNDDDDMLNYLVENNYIDKSDALQVSDIYEITENEYKDMTCHN